MSSPPLELQPVHDAHEDQNSTHTVCDDIPADAGKEVVQLARTITNASIANQHLAEGDNPFEGSADPRLNPLSGKFDYHLWIRSVLGLSQRDLNRTHRTAGISYQGLSAYGFGKPTDHQMTVGNILLDIPSMLFGLRGSSGRRIDILRDFEGLVKQGEMLVVLGRPGRYVISCHSSPFDLTSLAQWMHYSAQDHCW